MVILLGVDNTGVQPKETTILNTFKEFPEVTGCSTAGAICPQVCAKYLQHGLSAGTVAPSTRLGVAVHTARLFITLQGQNTALAIPAVPCQRVT